MENRKQSDFDEFHWILLLGLLGISIWAAIDPTSRFDWLLENILVWITVAILNIYKGQMNLSRRAHLLLTIFLVLQVYASHYAYQPEIGNWVGSIFESTRNSFDRVVHFFFGVLVFVPLKEYFQNVFKAENGLAILCSILAILAFGAIYEIVEWGLMVALNPLAGAEFVGAQGDIWDAQKDMALALFGAAISLMATFWQRK